MVYHHDWLHFKWVSPSGLSDNNDKIAAQYGQTCLSVVNSINHFYELMKFNYSDIIQSNVKYTNFKCIDVEQISKICEKIWK